ncbi:tetratricopeptide repeat protein [Candidatus Ozemobacteraceae bacterium]|nr:tetratricopeptide repeat protein [Candidatus Ozemobacteraceae bacterium]
MLPSALATLLRATSLVIAVTLAISPWIIAVDVSDPFLNQSWIIFGLAGTCLTIFAAVRLRFQPRRSQFPLLPAGIIAWIAIAAASLHSSHLVALRIGLLWSSLLLILFTLRAMLRDRDAVPLLMLVSASGLLMAVYALFQAFGYDVLTWPGSAYRVVGTLSNPQFLSAYLLTTSLVTIGLCLDPGLWPPAGRLILFLSGLIQASGMYATQMVACRLSFVFGIILFLTTFWETRPGKLLRATPLLAGSITSIILITIYGSISIGVSSYPWHALSIASSENISAITRLFEWSMGFKVFARQPLTGIGPGAAPYQLSSFRPQLGTVLGLSRYNDDPHAWPVHLLAETGLGGLFAACSLLAGIFGVHARRRQVPPPDDHDGTGDAAAPPIDPAPAHVSLPIRPSSTTGAKHSIARAAIVPAASLLYYGLFNNALSVTPLLTQLVLLVALHQALCLHNISWRRGFSLAALAWLFLLPVFAVTAWVSQSSHNIVESHLFSGLRQLEAGKPDAAERAFASALQQNPQHLQALWGLALSCERQGKTQRTMETLARLDTLSPNAFSAKYEIARLALENRLLLEAHRAALQNLNANHNPLSYELLGNVLLLEGRRAEAAQIFEEGLRLVPPWQRDEIEAADRIRLHLAELHTENGDWKKAEPLLAKLPRNLATSPAVQYMRGLAAYKAGNATDALALFELAVAADTASEPKYLNAVGFLLAETNGDLDRAQLLLEAAYRIYRSKQPPLLSDILQVTHSLGIVAWKKGQMKRAGELLQIVAEQSPAEWGPLTEERQADLRRFIAGGSPDRNVPLPASETTVPPAESVTATSSGTSPESGIQ